MKALPSENPYTWPIVKRVAKVFLTNTTLKPITIRIANIETIEGDAILGNFFFFMYCTGKSLSEALIFASTNPQYDNKLFIEFTSSIHENSKLKPGENILCTEIVSDIQNNFCTQHVLPMFCKKKSF